MGFELSPPDPVAGAALEAVLDRTELELEPAAAGYVSEWRAAGLGEGVEREPERDRYAPSPRSTRGATRA